MLKTQKDGYFGYTYLQNLNDIGVGVSKILLIFNLIISDIDENSIFS